MTAVMMCALAVHTVPETIIIQKKQNPTVTEEPSSDPVSLLTGSLEAAIFVEAFGSSLRQAYFQGSMLVVIGSAVLAHLYPRAKNSVQ